MTEAASQITTTTAGAGFDELASSGSVLPGRQLKIDDGGAIWASGDTMLTGYFDGRAVTDARDSDGWFRTGDLGAWDENLNLRVTGRADNMFVSGGENTYPERIEAGLLAIDSVERALVVAVPDLEFGNRAVAFVESDLGNDALEAAAREHLGGHLLPKTFHNWPGDGDTLKVSRAAFKQRAEDLEATL